jgi:aminoglycoside N3'-acetyltransferase
MITEESADGNAEKEFTLLQNIRIIKGAQILIHSSTTKLLHMTANAFFDALSHPCITLPGKTKTIKKLSEFVVIYHAVYKLKIKALLL